jgi:hypothetical protein
MGYHLVILIPNDGEILLLSKVIRKITILILEMTFQLNITVVITAPSHQEQARA